MPRPNIAPELAQNTLLDIRRESWNYATRKPGRVPPADSPARPALARLWATAYRLSMRPRKVRTFTYHSSKFGVIYIGSALCVMDWGSRAVLVKPPSTMAALAMVLNPQRGIDHGY